MRSEVKLDGTYYKLIGRPTQQLASQMASKVGQGSSEYGDLTAWSAWIQDDWQEGVGNLRPAQNSGLLYSEAETRVPNQIVLRGKLNQVDTRTNTGVLQDCKFNPTNVAGTFTVGSAITTTKAAISFTTPASLTGMSTVINPSVWIKVATGTVVVFEIRNNNAGVPGATVHTFANVAASDTFPGYGWMSATLAYSGTLVAATQYWLCVSTASGTFDVGYGTTGYNTASALLISGVWTAQASKYMCYLTNAYQFPSALLTNYGTGFFRFSTPTSNLYCYIARQLFKYSVANNSWSAVGAGLSTIYTPSIAEIEGVMYFADDQGAASLHSELSAAEVITTGSTNATSYANGNGYLWRTQSGKDVTYTADGITYSPSPAIRIGSTNHLITGMAPLGSDMCVSTNEGLYRVTAGDFPVTVLRWGSMNGRNGRSMVNLDGSLYVVADNRVYRFTQDLQRQDIWLTREDDFLTHRIGQPQAICACNNWLMALVSDGGANSKPSVWAFQNEKWHCIAILPDHDAQGASSDYSGYAIFYDYTTSKLWIMTSLATTYNIYIPATTINPYNDTSTVYAASAWNEWDWFDSPVREADKDYDSVCIMGENFGAGQTATVYWKDDASTDWELLGVCSANHTELRWTLPVTTRPNTTRFKLGVRLDTTNGASTPRIRAIRIKYHLMVKDWYRWSLVVDCSGRSGAFQEADDGSRNTLTYSQIKNAIAALAVQVPPFIYQDIDGNQYEVKVNDASFTYTAYEYNEQTTTEWWEGTWSLMLEQVTTGTYP